MLHSHGGSVPGVNPGVLRGGEGSKLKGSSGVFDDHTFNDGGSPLAALAAISQAILDHDVAYYITSSPSLSDAQYDELVAREKELCETHPDALKELERRSPMGAQVTRFGGRIGPGTAAGKVGFDSNTLDKVKHLDGCPMLSLDNAMDATAVKSFVVRLSKHAAAVDVSDSTITLAAEPKLDGLSLSLRYVLDDGVYKFNRGATRGDGATGDDVTAAVMSMSNIPRTFPPPPPLSSAMPHSQHPEVVEIRGEVILPLESFVRLSSQPDVNYTNARNAASGILRRRKSSEDHKLQSLLRFIAYDCTHAGALFSDSHVSFIQALGDLGFHTCGASPVVLSAPFDDLTPLLDYHASIIANRDELGYEVDGAVYKVDSYDARTSIGTSTRAPKWSIAHKFIAAAATTKIQGLDVQVGRTGAITPVAVLQPVDVAGVTVSRATLHNFAYVSSILGSSLSVGADVVVERAGDVIPQVKRRVNVDAAGSGETIDCSPPKKCPACGAATIYEEGGTGQVLRCSAHRMQCAPQALGSLSHAVGRTALDIPGLSEKKLKQLVDADVVTSMSDVLKLSEETNVEKIQALPGWGEKSVFNLQKSVRAARTRGVKLDRVIYALGIRHVGTNGAKLIAASMNNDAERWKELVVSKTLPETLIGVHGIGGVIVNSVRGFCNDEESVADMTTLLSLVSVAAPEAAEKRQTTDEAGTALPLANMKVVFTGTLSFISRDEAQAFAVERLGAESTPNTISKNTGVLVVGDKAGSKRDKAEALGVRVMEEDEFKQLFDLY
jgi:DNA ligase (NAD+)